MSRENDFEGRCTKCAKALPLTVQVINAKKITLSVDACDDHPGYGTILWPHRDDIRRFCSIHDGHASSGSCSCEKTNNSEG